MTKNIIVGKILNCILLVAIGLRAWQPGVACAAASPRMLLEVVDLSSVAISPDGQTVAFRQEQASVERNTYEAAWLVQTLDGKAPAQRVADGGIPLRQDYGGAVNEPPQWSADSRWFYYRALVAEEVQIWRAARDGSHVEPVTHDAADVESFALSQDGRHLIYFTGASREEIQRAELEEYDQGIRIDRTVPIGQGLFRSGYINGRLTTQRMSGKWMERTGLLSDRPKRRQIVDLVTFASHEATDVDSESFADQLPVATMKADGGASNGVTIKVRSSANGQIAFTQVIGPGMALKMTASSTSTTSIPCIAALCHDAYITALAWRPGHDEVVFTTVDHARGRAHSLYSWDVARGSVRPIVHAEGMIGGGRGASPGEACSVAARLAACVTASADEPPRLERVDLDTGAREVLYAPNASLVRAVGPRARLIRWKDSQGRVFTGQFFPPAGLKPAVTAPLFITYYSCSGFLRGGLGDEWPLASLAGSGIAALCINEPPLDLLHMNQPARYETATSGIRSVIDLLREHDAIDPTRVGLGGLSFGSEVVMWVAMNSDLLAAASVTSSSITPIYYRFHALQAPEFNAALRSLWGLGSPEETPELWQRLSPAFNLDKIHAPLLMQMPEREYLGSLDYFVPLANSTTPAELYVFPNEPHLKFQPRHKLAAYERNLDWFRFWLQGYVDPDPRKVDQYRRWRGFADKAAASAR
jgi:dipeptidyl aminopeptidase/acylaminoacyl peptidase